MPVDIPRLITAYYADAPVPSVPAQLVAFGASEHRGSSLEQVFNEWHILAISHAICLHRRRRRSDGPLFLGMDTHALSAPSRASALEVLAANGVEIMIAKGDEYPPTPAIFHAILTHNRGGTTGLADGIVITPSHNPPHDGGFRYNPPHGGPAGSAVTAWIEAKTNEALEAELHDVKRLSAEKALYASTTHRHDCRNAYITDLAHVLDMDAVRGAKLSLGVDPLGGAGVHYWGPIAERYGLAPTPNTLLTSAGPAADARRRAKQRMTTAAYHVAQRMRKRVEETLGWCKTIGGLRRTRFVGRWKIALQALTTAAAYNLLRLSQLRPAAT